MDNSNLDEINRIISSVFDDRYEVIDKIGAGGMGSVFLIETNDQFYLQRALKIVKKGENEIYNEVFALKSLDHQGIPKIIDIRETDDYIFIVEEFVRGKSLREVLEENGKIPEETALLWMNDLADILAYLHSRGLIHRDIKPTNIMITENGEVKIVDFGLAKEINLVDSIDRNVIGTRKYTAPERYDRRPADRRSDIYGFGSTCYYLITGEVPLEVTSTSRKPLKLMYKNLEKVNSPGIRNIIERCIDINPDERFQNFDEVRYNLQRMDVYNEAIINAEKKRRLHLFLSFLLISLGIVLMFTGYYYWQYERRQYYESLIRSAQESFDGNFLQEAKATYKQAIDFEPEQLAAYQGLYETYTKEGDYQSVIDDAKELLSNGPEAGSNSKLLYLIGNAYYELGEYEAAEPYLQQAVALEPSIENHLVLGLNYSEQGKYDQAQQTIKDLQALGGDQNPSTYLSGQISNRQGNTDAAVASFKQVIDNSKDVDLQQRAIRSLSQVYKDTNDYEGQISILKDAISTAGLQNDYQLSEMLAEAYYNAAEEYEDDSYYNQAADQFRDLLNKGYKRGYLYRNLAIIYQELGDFEEARATLDEMETEFPDDATANIQKAWLVLEEQGEVDELKRDYSEFVTQYNEAVDKDDGKNSSELQMLKQRYDELVSKGWL